MASKRCGLKLQYEAGKIILGLLSFASPQSEDARACVQPVKVMAQGHKEVNSLWPLRGWNTSLNEVREACTPTGYTSRRCGAGGGSGGNSCGNDGNGGCGCIFGCDGCVKWL